jgi:RNA polymerase sigma-70 factor (ECF subfamily)
VRWRLVRIGVDAETASDAVQEAMIALWRQRGRLPDGVPLRAWLTTVAARRAIDARRIAGRLTVGWPDGPGADRLAAPAADAPVLRAETAGQVRRMVGALAPDDRRLAALRFWQEASLAEIARQTGLTAPTVEGRLRRLRRHLRGAWMELEDGRPPPARRRRRAPTPRAPDP